MIALESHVKRTSDFIHNFHAKLFLIPSERRMQKADKHKL